MDPPVSTYRPLLSGASHRPSDYYTYEELGMDPEVSKLRTRLMDPQVTFEWCWSWTLRLREYVECHECSYSRVLKVFLDCVFC
jgi:hypothetical protein